MLEEGLTKSKACQALQLSRSSFYRGVTDRLQRDKPVIDRLNSIVSKHSRWGFWKCYYWMRQHGDSYNHKKVWRVYKDLDLNLPRRKKKRLPQRVQQPLTVSPKPHVMWSMDFMHDTLYHGKRFRTFNLFDEGVREVLAIEVDSSLPAERVIRVLDQVRESRSLPQQIRVDNGPELISSKLVAWCETHGVSLHHIQPGKPTQNAYVERFNRTFRHEVLDARLFTSLSQVREIVHEWMTEYNEERPHDSLGNMPPSLFKERLKDHPKTNNRTKNTTGRNSTNPVCH